MFSYTWIPWRALNLREVHLLLDAQSTSVISNALIWLWNTLWSQRIKGNLMIQTSGFVSRYNTTTVEQRQRRTSAYFLAGFLGFALFFLAWMASTRSPDRRTKVKFHPSSCIKDTMHFRPLREGPCGGVVMGWGGDLAWRGGCTPVTFNSDAHKNMWGGALKNHTPHCALHECGCLDSLAKPLHACTEANAAASLSMPHARAAGVRGPAFTPPEPASFRSSRQSVFRRDLFPRTATRVSGAARFNAFWEGDHVTFSFHVDNQEACCVWGRVGNVVNF